MLATLKNATEANPVSRGGAAQGRMMIIATMLLIFDTPIHKDTADVAARIVARVAENNPIKILLLKALQNFSDDAIF